MTAYDLYLFVHVGAAIVWIGAGFVMVVLATRASLAPEPERMVTSARDAEWLGLRLFFPANLLVLASAFLLVEEGSWAYDKLWIQLGLGGFLVTFLTGALFFGPGWATVVKLADSEGIHSRAVQARIRRLLFASRLDLGLLLGIVFVMTVKPTADEPGALAVAAAIPAAVAAIAFVLLRTEASREPAMAVEPGPV